MKNKWKIPALMLCFLTVSVPSFAASEEETSELHKEQTIIGSDTGDYLETEEDKKIVPFDPAKKNDIHESRGKIIMNVDQKGQDYNPKGNKFDLIPITTANGNSLKILVNYGDIDEDVVLLGTTDEQELASMTKNLTQEAKDREAEKERIKRENDEQLENRNREYFKDKEAEKQKKKQRLGMLILPIILLGVAIALILKFLGKKKKSKESMESFEDIERLDEDQALFENRESRE